MFIPRARLIILTLSSCFIKMAANSYKQYAIPSPGEDLHCLEKNLSTTIANLPSKGILVRVHSAGVCHTDLHQWLEGGYRISDTEIMSFEGRDNWNYPYPHVPGHEIAGTIYELGKGLVGEGGECLLKRGDRVCVYPWIGCTECISCINGYDDYCIGTNNSNEIGFNLDGGYSEYITVPHYRYALPIPETISMDLAAILGCSSLTAYNAVKSASELIPHPLLLSKEEEDSPQYHNIAVIGLGGVGQWALSFIPLLLSTCVYITGIDVQQAKLDHFKSSQLIQNSHCLSLSDPIDKQVHECCQSISSKYNLVIDFVNNPLTFDLSLSLLGNGGTLVSVGLFGGTGSVKLPLLALGRKRIVGIQTGSLEYMKQVMELIKSNLHSIKSPSLIAYSFHDCMQALKDLKDHKIQGRAILKIVPD